MTFLCLILYQGFLAVFGTVYLALRVVRGRGLPGVFQRMGFYPAAVRRRLKGQDRPIWLHVVSVGEALAAQGLVEALRLRRPEIPWVVTTVTPTGREVARRLVRPDRDVLLYLPWDFGWIVRAALRLIRPRLFVAFETELWPVLFHRLDLGRIPMVVANGRISPAAYRRYLLGRFLIARTLAPVSLVLAQSPQDARRFAALGAAKDRLVVAGNVKWDRPPQAGSDGEGRRVRGLLGIVPDELLWISGSTHPGEESLLLAIYRNLKRTYPGLRLLIAPRHPDRVAEVEQEVQRLGLPFARRSRLRAPFATSREPVILLDTLGELHQLYTGADIVFVGGSLVPHGGHNLAEPAALKRALLAGPHLDNFQAISESLASAGGMVIARSAPDLEEKIRRLLGDPSARQALGERAHRVMLEHQGATQRSSALIARILEVSSRND
jgi:3-deoxy-D-manno-octulosonic-acid transferase